MIQVFLGLTKNSVLMDGKGPNLHLPKYMQPNMYPLGCKGIKRTIDYRELNKKLKRNAYPMRKIFDIIPTLQGKR